MTRPASRPGKPMEESALHRALVVSNNLQSLPNEMIMGAFVLDALVSLIFWEWSGAVSAGIVAVGVLIAGFANWLLLRQLPATGRSYGPDKPSALALGAVFGITAAAVGLLRLPPIVALALLAAITAGAFYATWIEPFNLQVTHQTLRTEAWNADRPLRLLHVGDIHVERITPRERRLNALIDELHPDVIVFSGDFVNLSYNDDLKAMKDIREIVGAWHAPFGVFCVPGTPIVEPLERVSMFLNGLSNATLLVNRWARVDAPGGTLNILGMVTTHNLDTDRAILQKMVAPETEADEDRGSRDSSPNVVDLLLVHAPDIAPEAARAGFDLYLCGHTHGGQVRLPLIGALMSSSHLGKQFVMGRYQVGGMTLYTSRGVGMEGLGAPRARLFCPPEITLWEIC